MKKKDQYHYLLKLTEDDLNALQKSIKEGLKENYAVEDASQNAAVTVYEKINKL